MASPQDLITGLQGKTTLILFSRWCVLVDGRLDGDGLRDISAATVNYLLLLLTKPQLYDWAGNQQNAVQIACFKVTADILTGAEESNNMVTLTVKVKVWYYTDTDLNGPIAI